MSYFDGKPDTGFFSKLTTAIESVWIVMFAVIVGIPLFIIQWTISETQNVVTPNVVWVVEMNPNLWQGLKEDDKIKNYYVKVGSLYEAEEWLLDNGYQKIRLPTTQIGGDFSSLFKTFPIKGTSVISVVVDYGNGDLHRIFFRYPDGESGINFGRFEKAKPTRLPFELPWRSSDISGMHNVRDY